LTTTPDTPVAADLPPALPPGVLGPADPEAARDPRRWITLAIIVVAVVIVSLDNTVLTVAIPTILREFHTTLPSLQWVITGYSLTFATLLIIGGRLGDLYGHRRMFIVGAALFAVGSLIASESSGVLELVIGEAIIEGIGASLMLPSTLAILSLTFEGAERATAFGLWAAVGGASAVVGPVVGGVLTSDFSWRWSFRINLIVAPLAIVGALIFMRRESPSGAGGRLDVKGAFLIAAGMLCLVFGLSEGGTYGWWHPIAPFVVAGSRLWSAAAPVSIIPVAFAAGVGLLGAFVWLEKVKERQNSGPLFELGQLRHRGFRYGLLTTLVVGTGQYGLAFVLPVFLQYGKRLSAARNGLWQLPIGLFFLIGSQIGSRLTRRTTVTAVVRIGLVMIACGFFYVAAVLSVGLTFWELLPGMITYGIGGGMATAQLTNVVLDDVDRDKSGVASGANSTARQVGLSLGVAIMGTILASGTISAAVRSMRSASLAAPVKARAVAAFHAQGVSYRPPAGTSAHDLVVLRHVFLSSIASGARLPLLFAGTLVVVSGIVSTRIPRVGSPGGGPGGSTSPPALTPSESTEYTGLIAPGD
jgi:EmrB/QacA subfamily drug resistance transporter